MEDHIHILCDINCMISVADFVRDLKTSSSVWAKKSGLFPSFIGWSDGYGGFTCNWYGKEDLITYIKNQQHHHRKISFEEEFRKILEEYGIEINEKFFSD